ncbi:uncharacterized protein LY89DRAFT_733356 [Mollisia scopiformis]|uniref:Uncharacterized protein n=1 Tax=Mollisia scopiformis TaxID=149040 RepID=A0A194XBG9_MOLSC|nr:uncharacterized protein LY89DRAFT_733356 [Mollisia scopiformis]KUJ17510.1 hypothetical protein LY89DRAFT_733356 [Mollisia scopiformis]
MCFDEQNLKAVTLRVEYLKNATKPRGNMRTNVGLKPFRESTEDEEYQYEDDLPSKNGEGSSGAKVSAVPFTSNREGLRSRVPVASSADGVANDNDKPVTSKRRWANIPKSMMFFPPLNDDKDSTISKAVDPSADKLASDENPVIPPPILSQVVATQAVAQPIITKAEKETVDRILVLLGLLSGRLNSAQASGSGSNLVDTVQKPMAKGNAKSISTTRHRAKSTADDSSDCVDDDGSSNSDSDGIEKKKKKVVAPERSTKHKKPSKEDPDADYDDGALKKRSAGDGDSGSRKRKYKRKF